MHAQVYMPPKNVRFRGRIGALGPSEHVVPWAHHRSPNDTSLGSAAFVRLAAASNRQTDRQTTLRLKCHHSVERIRLPIRL